MLECCSHLKANMLFTSLQLPITLKTEALITEKSKSSVIFWFPDSVMGKQLE